MTVIDIEKMLIAKIVAESNLDKVTESGITLEFFDGAKNRQMFRDLGRYQAQYGKVPTLEMLRRDHPTVDLPHPDEPFDYLIDQILHNREHNLLQEAVLEATECLQYDDPKSARGVFERALSRVALAVPSITMRDNLHDAEAIERRRKAYADLRKRDGRMLGIPSGFDSIDEVTQGFQPGQLVTVVGLPKAGKSTLMVVMAMAGNSRGFRVLFISFEMSNEEQAQRQDAIHAGVSHHRLITGKLNAAEEKRLNKSWNAQEPLPDFVLWGDANAASRLSSLRDVIAKEQPDIVFLDGVYMMKDEEGEPQGSPQAITNITRGLKRLAAQQLDIPIVISTQALTWKIEKKRGVTANSIGYSSSFFQDSDLLLAVEQTELDDTNKLKILGARNAGTMEKFIRWDWDVATFEELDDNPFEHESLDRVGGDEDVESGFVP